MKTPILILSSVLLLTPASAQLLDKFSKAMDAVKENAGDATKMLKGAAGFTREEEQNIGDSVALEIISAYGGIWRDEAATRRVNLIADKALLAAFSENTHTVRPKHIEAAVRDSEFSQQPPRRGEAPGLWRGATLLAVGAVLGIGIYVTVQNKAEPPATTAALPAQSSGTVTAAPLAPANAASAGPVAPPAGEAARTRQSDLKPAPTAIAAEPATNGADLLESRLAATRSWLDQEAQSKFSIQLMGTHDPDQLKDLLNSIGKVVEINKVFVYRTTANRKPSLTVLYGSFVTPREARDALDKLPASLKTNRPILRTVQGVRAEIAEIKQQQPS